MPNRRLTQPEIASLNELQNVTVAALQFLAGDDPELLFALRRRLYTRLMHLERGTPMHRTKLKRLKWKAQEGKCAICGKAMDQKGSELDRFKASDGYTVENTRLVHHECHVADQQAKGYNDAGPENREKVTSRSETRTATPSQRDMMRALYREHGADETSVCAAYAQAEIDGRVARKRGADSVTPETYAKALWNDGTAKGWLAS